MSNPQRPEREAIEQALREYTIQWRGVPVDIATVADALLAALPPTPTPRLPCYCCLESGCSDGCMCSRACSVCQGEDVPCAKCKGSGRELVAREAPADAPPATPRDILFAPCQWCGYNGADYWQAGPHGFDCPWFTVGGMRERELLLPQVQPPPKPAAEPPAPPAQRWDSVQDSAAFISNEQVHEVDAGGEEYRDILRRERDEARAEAVRLQEELENLLMDRSDNSGRYVHLLFCNGSRTGPVGHSTDDICCCPIGQRVKRETRRADKLEAEAQALREMAEVRIATDSVVLKSLAPCHRKSIIAGQLQVWQQVLALLSHAQAAP
jgi:hypothetical protein